MPNYTNCDSNNRMIRYFTRQLRDTVLTAGSAMSQAWANVLRLAIEQVEKKEPVGHALSGKREEDRRVITLLYLGIYLSVEPDVVVYVLA